MALITCSRGKRARFHAQRIENAALSTGALVLLSPVGYSPSGQAFNLAADELSADVALALNADKLLAFDTESYVTDTTGQPQTILSPTRLDELLDNEALPNTTQGHLRALLRACRGGVPRCHLVSFVEDGALLGELFTARGRGTQITEDHADLIRPARLEDVAGIVELIRPLEESGALVRRSRDRLEQEIERFFVAEIDGIVVGCCAVYPFETAAELACVAVHASYRKLSDEHGLGTRLLKVAEAAATQAGLASNCSY